MGRELVSRKFKFSKTAIDSLPVHPRDSCSREQEYSDEQVTGLKILVSKNGRKFFHFRYSYRKRKKALSIGEFPAVSVQEARDKALEFRNLLSKGIDPQTEKKNRLTALTFSEFTEKEYLPYATQSKKSWKDDQNKLKADMLPVFGEMTLNDITTRDIQKYIVKITERTSGSTANRHYSLLCRMFNLAVQWQFIKENPCKTIRKQKESGGKERFMGEEEIKRFLAALDDIGMNVATCALRFLLFTGLRFSEAITLRWEYVDLKAGQIKLVKTKAGKARAVVLNELAKGVLQDLHAARESDWVFPGSGPKGHVICLKRTFNKVREIADIHDFRIHDLRHTFASIAINSGSSLYEVQKLLGHHSSQMTQRYAHLADSSMKSATDGVATSIQDSLNK